jgi:hypothetical protein
MFPMVKPCRWESSLQPGDHVHVFRDAGDGFGELIAQFDNLDQLQEMLPKLNQYINVEVE